MLSTSKKWFTSLKARPKDPKTWLNSFNAFPEPEKNDVVLHLNIPDDTCNNCKLPWQYVSELPASEVDAKTIEEEDLPVIVSDYKILEASMKSCRGCNIFHQFILAYLSEKDHGAIRSLLFDKGQSRGGSFLRGRSYLLVCSDRGIFPLQFFGHTPVEELDRTDAKMESGYEPVFDTHIPTSGNTASRESFELASSWSETCINTHEQCQEGRRKKQRPILPTLPTRILDVSEPLIRLVSGKGRRDNWASLSHCWGTDTKPISTTTSNITSHEAGIPFHNFPKTFQEAITFTRHLRLKYLWIDSLCIIQNDLHDWNHESLSMATIYAHAYISLAATAARSSTSGLFSSSLLQSPFLHITTPHAPIQLRATQRILHMQKEYHYLTIDPSNFPLLSRAWAFQERLLSPRVLHFTAHELAFECKQERHCECGTDTSLAKGIKQINTLVPQHENYLNRRNADTASIWRELVTLYSLTQLTNASDKLPAFSGIMATHQRLGPQLAFDASSSSIINTATRRRKGQDAYLAGLWASSIAIDLSWLVPTLTQRTTPWHAPSWSWASIPSGISYGRFEGTSKLYSSCSVLPLITLLHYRCVRHLGRAIAASLCVRGVLARATLVDNDTVTLGTEERDVLQGKVSWDEDLPVGERGGDFWALALHVTKPEFVTREVVFLLLTPCERKAGVFLRRGLVRALQAAEFDVAAWLEVQEIRIVVLE